MFFPSSLWLEERRPGGHRHGFQTIAWRRPYPTLEQWVTSFLHPNLRIKFQVSPSPAMLAPFENLVMHLTPEKVTTT